MVDINHASCLRKLARVAKNVCKTMYRVKHGLLDDYLFQQLKKPFIEMTFA